MVVVEDVTKVYRTRKGPRTILDKINLRVEKGQHIGVLGRNGSGKSTLIRLISGVEMPTRGRVHRSMKVSWPLAFGGAFQDFMTGADNMRFVCRVYGVDFRRAQPFIEDFAELGIYMREPLRHYSSGMRARLAFALSLAIDFDCYLIDEVTAVGDSRFHEKCRVELFERRKDRALIFVSHNPNDIAAHCQSASVLHEGLLYSFPNVEQAYAFYSAPTEHRPTTP